MLGDFSENDNLQALHRLLLENDSVYSQSLHKLFVTQLWFYDAETQNCTLPKNLEVQPRSIKEMNARSRIWVDFVYESCGVEGNNPQTWKEVKSITGSRQSEQAQEDDVAVAHRYMEKEQVKKVENWVKKAVEKGAVGPSASYPIQTAGGAVQPIEAPVAQDRKPTHGKKRRVKALPNTPSLSASTSLSNSQTNEATSILQSAQNHLESHSDEIMNEEKATQIEQVCDPYENLNGAFSYKNAEGSGTSAQEQPQKALDEHLEALEEFASAPNQSIVSQSAGIDVPASEDIEQHVKAPEMPNSFDQSAYGAKKFSQNEFTKGRYQSASSRATQPKVVPNGIHPKGPSSSTHQRGPRIGPQRGAPSGAWKQGPLKGSRQYTPPRGPPNRGRGTQQRLPNRLIDVSEPSCKDPVTTLPRISATQAVLTPAKAPLSPVTGWPHLFQKNLSPDRLDDPHPANADKSQPKAQKIATGDTVRISSWPSLPNDRVSSHHGSESLSRQTLYQQRLDELQKDVNQSRRRRDKAQSSSEAGTRTFHRTMNQKAPKPQPKSSHKTKKRDQKARVINESWGPPQGSRSSSEAPSEARPRSGLNLDGAARLPSTAQPTLESLPAGSNKTDESSKTDPKLSDQERFATALTPILSAARGFPGELGLEIQIGQILILNVPVQYQGKYNTRKSWDALFNPSSGLQPPGTDFTDILTTSGADADFMLDVKTSKNTRIFAEKPHIFSVWYEFHCQTKDNDDFILLIDEEGQCGDEEGRYHINCLPKPLTSIHLHYPKHTWDARAFVKATLPFAPNKAVAAAVKELVDNLYIPGGRGKVMLYTRFESKDIQIDRVMMRRFSRSAYLANADIYLQITEVQDLACATNQDVKTAFRARAWSQEEMVDHNPSKLWYEVCLGSKSFEDLLLMNMHLEVGEVTTAWSEKEITESETLKDLLGATSSLVSKIDAVGAWNQGPGVQSAPTTTAGATAANTGLSGGVGNGWAKAVAVAQAAIPSASASVVPQSARGGEGFW